MKLQTCFRWARFPLVLVCLLYTRSAAAAVQNVNIANFDFNPSPVTIDLNDSVTWVQVDATPHTSTSDSSVWNSGTLTRGKTFTFQFKTAGTFPYHCGFHPSMRGTVIVRQAANQPPTVSLDSPGNGALFLLPATVTLSATASDPDGSVTNVEFFEGVTSLGRVTVAPYTLAVSSLTQATHSIFARATDNQGVSSDSSPVSIVVTTYNAYSVHALVSDLPGLADRTDTNLLNPWGIAFNATGPFWISDNHSSRSTLYDGMGMAQALVVEVASPGAPTGGAPTGVIFNSTTGFETAPGQPARFLFCTEDGTVCAWREGTTAAVKADRSVAGAIYKGLALASTAGGPRLFVADFHNGKVDVFDGQFNSVTPVGTFGDPTLPPGYAPFNIVPFRGNLLVSYALQDEDKEDDHPGEGHGFVNVFDTDGHLVRRFASEGPLNSPWAMVEAPDGFGEFSQMLLIGNFGDGRINVFNPDTAEFVEALASDDGEEISVEGLWDLKFGNGHSAGDVARLYFTAGISGGGDGALEDHGLFGVISAVPSIEIEEVEREGDSLVLHWVGGFAPFKVQRRESLTTGDWADATTTSSATATVPITVATGFFRVLDAGGAVGATGVRQGREVWCRAPR